MCAKYTVTEIRERANEEVGLIGEEFVQTLNSIKIQPGEIMVSFDIVSLFTNVLIMDSLQLLSKHFDKDVLALFKHTLTSTYFCFNGQYYEQTDGVSHGLTPLTCDCQLLYGGFRKKSHRKDPV